MWEVDGFRLPPVATLRGRGLPALELKNNLTGGIYEDTDNSTH